MFLFAMQTLFPFRINSELNGEIRKNSKYINAKNKVHNI